MGTTQSSDQVHAASMKFLVALALVAAAVAEPEADPQVYTTGLYNPYTYSSVYSPYTYGSYIKPAVYGGYGYRVFKREAEAEAEPEADPALLYGNGLYSPYTYSGVYSPYTYGTYGSYIKPAVYGGYGYRLFKRDAEAEPKADPALLYSNGLYSPYAYSSIYRPYTYGSYIRPAVYGGLYY